MAIISTSSSRWRMDCLVQGVDISSCMKYNENIMILIGGKAWASLTFCSDDSYDYETRTYEWIKSLWCDAGVGHFLIRRADLLAGRYENAWFYWDCS